MKQITDSVSTINEVASDGTTINSTIWISTIIIGIVTIFLTIIFFVKKNSKREQFKKKIINETSNLDFKNITHDWEKSKQLYDILKKKCHPDKFDDDLKEEATRLFQKIGKSKYNYQDLVRIKKEVTEKLGIKFDENIN